MFSPIFYIPWRIHGAAIYGVPWIPSIYPRMLAYIPAPWILYGYGSIPINTIVRGMNIHLPAILMFTRGIGFWPIPIWVCFYPFFQWNLTSRFNIGPPRWGLGDGFPGPVRGSCSTLMVDSTIRNGGKKPQAIYSELGKSPLFFVLAILKSTVDDG